MWEKSNVGAILTYAYTLIFAVVLAVLMFGSVPTVNEKYFLLLLGSLVGFAGAGVNYFLGSSLGSAKKDDAIAGRVPPKGDTTTTTGTTTEPKAGP